MIPDYWTQFVDTHILISKNASIPDENDKSGVGADLKIMTAAECLDEAKNYWPGIGVSGDGYVPVAMCLIGSGDPYFINSNDGKGGPLYRIYHDSVGENGYAVEDAIAIVLENYEQVLEYVEF